MRGLCSARLGGAAGIGAATAADLRARGARVVVADRVETGGITVDLSTAGGARRMGGGGRRAARRARSAREQRRRVRHSDLPGERQWRAPLAPHTVATVAVLRALETRRIDEIAPPPATLLAVDEVVAGVLRFVDDSIAGGVLVPSGEEAPRLL